MKATVTMTVAGLLGLLLSMTAVVVATVSLGLCWQYYVIIFGAGLGGALLTLAATKK